MTIDFNNAGQPRSRELIPDNTVAPIELKLRPGGAGEEGCLTPTRDGTALMLVFDCIVIEGPYAGRTFVTRFVVEGETAGQLKAVEISHETVRKMLESAHGIEPSDKSEAALAARKLDSWQALDGLRFWAVIGIEKGTGSFKDRNKLKAIVTPERKNWSKIDQAPSPASAPAAPASGGRPS